MDFKREALTNVGEQHGILRVRGLPYHSDFSDIYSFFSGYKLLSYGIYRAYDFNRPSGSCFVVFETHKDSKNAMSKNKKRLGGRYLELFHASLKEFY